MSNTLLAPSLFIENKNVCIHQMTKEYIVAQTAHSKRSVFYHWDGQKKRHLSMTEAYKKHSSFGLAIHEYKSGKLVKTHAGKKVKRTKRQKSMRTNFGMHHDVAMHEIKKLVVSDSAKHDFKDDFPILCIRAWKHVIPELEGNNDFKTEEEISDAIWKKPLDGKQKEITFHGTLTPEFWETPKYLLADASPWAMPVCRTQAYDKEHVDLTHSSFSPLHKNPHIEMAISMFTLTDPAKTREELSRAFVNKITNPLFRLRMSNKTLLWKSADSAETRETFSFTGHIEYKINTVPFGVTMTFRDNSRTRPAFTTAFSTIVINLKKRAPGARPDNKSIRGTPAAKAAVANDFNNYDFIYDSASSVLPHTLVCWGLAPSKADLADMIRVLYPDDRRADLSVVARLLEIKRLGDWGQVMHTTIEKARSSAKANRVKHALVTGDRPCYYYATLLAEVGMDPRVMTIKGRSSVDNTEQYKSRAVGLDASPGQCTPYPQYIPGKSGRTSKTTTHDTTDDDYYYLRRDTTNNDTTNNDSTSKLLIDFWYMMDGYYTLFTECRNTNKQVSKKNTKTLVAYKYICLDPAQGDIYEDESGFVFPAVGAWVVKTTTIRLRDIARDLTADDLAQVSKWKLDKTSESNVFREHLKRQLKRFNGRIKRTPNVIAFSHTPNASPRSGWKAHLDTIGMRDPVDPEVDYDVEMNNFGAVEGIKRLGPRFSNIRGLRGNNSVMKRNTLSKGRSLRGHDNTTKRTNPSKVKVQDNQNIELDLVSHQVAPPSRPLAASRRSSVREHQERIRTELADGAIWLREWLMTTDRLNGIYEFLRNITTTGVEYVKLNQSSVQSVLSVNWEFMIHKGLIEVRVVNPKPVTVPRGNTEKRSNEQRTRQKLNRQSKFDQKRKGVTTNVIQLEDDQRNQPPPQKRIRTGFGKTREKKKALAKLSRFGVTFRNGKFKQKSKTISWEKAWALYKKK